MVFFLILGLQPTYWYSLLEPISAVYAPRGSRVQNGTAVISVCYVCLVWEQGESDIHKS